MPKLDSREFESASILVTPEQDKNGIANNLVAKVKDDNLSLFWF